MSKRAVAASGGWQQGLGRHDLPVSTVSLEHQQPCRAVSAPWCCSDQPCTAEDDWEAQHLAAIKVSLGIQVLNYS